MNTRVNDRINRFSMSSRDSGRIDGKFIVPALKNPVVAIRFKKNISMNVKPRKREIEMDILMKNGPVAMSKYPAAMDIMANIAINIAVSAPLILLLFLICRNILSGSSFILERFIGLASRNP